MVELVVGLLCILVVLAGLLQIVLLSTADTDAMVDAVAEATSLAAGNLVLASTFTPVRDWSAGPDGYEQTSDDEARRGSLGSVQSVIARPTAPFGDWSAVDEARHSSIALLHHGLLPSTTYGFVSARGARTVETLPAARILFGLPADMEVRHEVWMTTLGGLY